MDNHPFQDNDNQIQGHFEDVGDLNEVQQENINQGWEQPPPPPRIMPWTGLLSLKWIMLWLMKMGLS
jgi:hypothetical protein